MPTSKSHIFFTQSKFRRHINKSSLQNEAFGSQGEGVDGWGFLGRKECGE